MKKQLLSFLLLLFAGAPWALGAKTQDGAAAKAEAATPASPHPNTSPAQQPPAASTATAPAATPQNTNAQGGMDVTITGVAKDDIPIVKTPPPLEVPFKEVVNLSPEGRTDAVLTKTPEHFPFDSELKLMRLMSAQTILPVPIRIPKPPFFRMETPHGLTPFAWEFQIVDQNNVTVKSIQGKSFPQTLLEWDGYEGGVFKVKAGQAYSPVLVLTDREGMIQRFYGESLQWDALLFDQDGLRQVEFLNDRLYERAGVEFSPDMLPLLNAALNQLRVSAGTAFRVILYENAKDHALGQKRLAMWKELLLNQLMLEETDFTLTLMPPKSRGLVTSIMTALK